MELISTYYIYMCVCAYHLFRFYLLVHTRPHIVVCVLACRWLSAFFHFERTGEMEVSLTTGLRMLTLPSRPVICTILFNDCCASKQRLTLVLHDEVH